MARSGILSDSAIKMNCPEFFPPDLFTQSSMHPVTLQRNIYKGIKIPTETKTYSFSRFPINDMRIMASIVDPVRSEQIFRESVSHYRSEIGATTSDPIQAPSEALTDFADTESMITHHTAPSVLTLRRTPRHALAAIEKEVPGISSVLEPRTRLMISTLAPAGDYSNPLLALGLSNPRAGKLSHNEALSRLQNYYKDSEEDLDKLAHAHAAADAIERMHSKEHFSMNVVPTHFDARNMLKNILEEEEADND